MNASYLAGHLRFGVGSGYWSAGTAVRWGRDGWVEAGLGFVIGGPREFMRGSVGRMAMGGAGIKARGAPPDERQQPDIAPTKPDLPVRRVVRRESRRRLS